MTEEDKEIEHWKSVRQYHISENIDECCFTCMKGEIQGVYINCKQKRKDLPNNYKLMSFGGVCNRFISVYVPKDKE